MLCLQPTSLLYAAPETLCVCFVRHVRLQSVTRVPIISLQD